VEEAASERRMVQQLMADAIMATDAAAGSALHTGLPCGSPYSDPLVIVPY